MPHQQKKEKANCIFKNEDCLICPRQNDEHLEREVIKEFLPKKENKVSGKTITSLLFFYTEGRKGKSIVFATPEGAFLSPKAVKQRTLTVKKQALEEVEKIMRDTLSADVPKYHKEVDEMYEKLEKLKGIK